jgi:hypothetical protein
MDSTIFLDDNALIQPVILLGAADSSGAQLLVNNIMSGIYFICLIFALYIRMCYPPKDFFVRKALFFLIISLAIRLVMTTGRFVLDQ